MKKVKIELREDIVIKLHNMKEFKETYSDVLDRVLKGK